MIKIYSMPLSGHGHRARLAASLMGVPFEVVPVNEMEGERRGEAFLGLNPLGQVPVIVDGDRVVRDSNAILLYLAETYDGQGRFLPKDPGLRAEVYEWLGAAAGHIFRGPNMARLIELFGLPGDMEAAKAVSATIFDVMERRLDGRTWLVGDGPTLADIACYSYIAVADEGGLSLAGHPNLEAWLAAVEGLDGFVAMPKSQPAAA